MVAFSSEQILPSNGSHLKMQHTSLQMIIVSQDLLLHFNQYMLPLMVSVTNVKRLVFYLDRVGKKEVVVVAEKEWAGARQQGRCRSLERIHCTYILMSKSVLPRNRKCLVGGQEEMNSCRQALT